MRSFKPRKASLDATALGVAGALALLAFASQEPPALTPPVKEAPAQTPPAQAPPAAEAPQPAQEPGAAATPAPEQPRIIRVVCTDHLCGNCDGKCRKESGHVAVDKKGHCSCTPT